MPEPTEVVLVDFIVFSFSWYSYCGKRRIVRYLSKQRKKGVNYPGLTDSKVPDFELLARPPVLAEPKDAWNLEICFIVCFSLYFIFKMLSLHFFCV